MNRKDVQQGRFVYHARHPGRLDALFPMAEVHWGGPAEFLDLTQLALFDPAAQRDAGALVGNRT